jgi:GTP cyclohydrolase II
LSPNKIKQPDPLLTVDRAVAELRRGGFVIITAGRSAVIVQAAEAVTPHSLNRLAELAGSEPRLVLTAPRAAAVGVPVTGDGPVLMPLPEGSSAQEIRALAEPGEPISIRLPAPVTEGNADTRAGFIAAVALTKIARLLPAALAAVLPSAITSTKAFARTHDLLTVPAADTAGYEGRAAHSLRAIVQARVPLAGAEDARIVAYRPSDGGIEHLAIVIGDPKPGEPVLTRLHSECFTGDLLGSLRCDCGDQLRGAIEEISAAGTGVLIYLAQEGRGIGLVNKLRAYNLQDAGHDTLDANEQLGFDADERIYLPAAEILRDLDFTQVLLMTNNPEKVEALARCGIDVVKRVPHIFPTNTHNEEYLSTKKARSGHMF